MQNASLHLVYNIIKLKTEVDHVPFTTDRFSKLTKHSKTKRMPLKLKITLNVAIFYGLNFMKNIKNRFLKYLVCFGMSTQALHKRGMQ